jgi:hypothetical protein
MAEAEGEEPSSTAAPERTGAVAPSRLQPKTPADTALDIGVHLTRSERDEAAHIDRLAADAELVDILRGQGFSGDDYDYAARELVRYGVAVLTRWLLTEEIYPILSRRFQVGLERPRPGLMKDEAISLAGEVVAVALNRFRTDVLIPNKWVPSKGASLTTFFVGQCLLRLPNIHRRWLKESRDKFYGELDEGARKHYALGELSGRTRNVEDDVITELIGATHLSTVRNIDARKALVYTAFGYPQAEIAVILNTTEKAVERMIAYARTQVRRTKESA